MRFCGTGVLTLGLTLLGPTDLVQVQFRPTTAKWHVRSTDHFEIYYTQAPDLAPLVLWGGAQQWVLQTVGTRLMTRSSDI
jgi:hypothetical protein